VVILDTAADALNATVEDIGREGCTALGVLGDVSQPRDCERAVADAVRAHGGLDLLFANAGIAMLGAVDEVALEDIHRTVDINLKGMMFIAKYAVPHLKQSASAAIVFTGSEMAFAADPANPVYVASKGGVVMLMKSLALDLIRFNIRVNAVCPGVTNTALLQQEVATSPDPAAREAENRAWAPIGRVAEPMEIAHPALFLASEAASFMVGSAVLVDGGFTAK
jgi:NAD(P)-dependent dehydrogenase (short-subunit alcohol dehydrogenase family)